MTGQIGIADHERCDKAAQHCRAGSRVKWRRQRINLAEHRTADAKWRSERSTNVRNY